MSQVAVGKRKTKASVAEPAPARHQSGQTERVLNIIAGYNSVSTLSEMFRFGLFVWLVPTVSSFGIGVFGLNGGSNSLYRLADAVAFGVMCIAVLSIGFLIHWFDRVQQNVPMLDADASVGTLKAVGLSLKLTAGTAPLAIAARFVPGFDHLFLPALGLVGIALSAGVVAFFLSAAKMLWASSATTATQDEEFPQAAMLVIVAWFASVHLWWIQRLVLRSTPWTGTHSLTHIVSGLLMGFVAVAGGAFIASIARRQEERLVALGGSVGEQTRTQSVSSEAIQREWGESESLIGFDYD